MIWSFIGKILMNSASFHPDGKLEAYDESHARNIAAMVCCHPLYMGVSSKPLPISLGIGWEMRRRSTEMTAGLSVLRDCKKSSIGASKLQLIIGFSLFSFHPSTILPMYLIHKNNYSWVGERWGIT